MFVNTGDRAGRGRASFPTLKDWKESQSVTAPNTTFGVSAWNVVGPLTNMHAAIVPQGTGGIVVQTPDGTITGGNQRNATRVLDFQWNRNAANQIAGEDGTALFNTENCLIEDTTTHGTRRLAGIYSSFGSSITGANWAGPAFMASCSGTCTLTKPTSSFMIGCIDSSLTDSGGYSGMIATRLSTMNNTTNSSTGNVIMCGRDHSAGLASNTLQHGYEGKARGCTAAYYHAINSGGPGGTQYGRYVLRCQTINGGGTANMTADGGGAGALNRVGPVPSGATFTFRNTVIMAKTGDGHSVGVWTVPNFAVSNDNFSGVPFFGPAAPACTNIFLSAAFASFPLPVLSIVAITGGVTLNIFVDGSTFASTVQWSTHFDPIESTL